MTKGKTPNRRQKSDYLGDYSTKGGYRVRIGKFVNAKGTLANKPMYLGHDAPEARTKKAFIIAEWEKIQNAGGTHWTAEALDHLVSQGIISPQKPTFKRHEVVKIFTEPMKGEQLAPFKDERGEIKQEAAIGAMDALARSFFSRTDVRSLIFDEWLEALHNRRGTALLKELSGIFEWTGQQAQQFLFNVNGTVALGGNAIAVDASENRKKAASALDDILDNEPNEADDTQEGGTNES